MFPSVSDELIPTVVPLGLGRLLTANVTDAIGLEPSGRSVRHHLPQLLEEVLDEDEALWLRSTALRDRGRRGKPSEDEPVAFEM